MSRREQYNRMTGKHLPEKGSMTLAEIRQWQREIMADNEQLNRNARANNEAKKPDNSDT